MYITNDFITIVTSDDIVGAIYNIFVVDLQSFVMTAQLTIDSVLLKMFADFCELPVGRGCREGHVTSAHRPRQ